jgi:hypothetical protein
MHVDRENLSAKLWLDPDIRLAENLGYNRHELRVIERLARENLERLRNEWDNFCRGATNQP